MTDQRTQPSSLWRRLFASMGVLAAFAALSFIPVPGAPEAAFNQFGAAFSLGAFGIGPFISAFLLVEIVALIVPKWRELRVSGIEGRARLRRASIVLALILTGAQGWGTVTMLESFEYLDAQPMLMMASWLAVWALIVVLVEIVDRAGLGQSFSLLIVAGGLLEITRAYPDHSLSQLAAEFGGGLTSAVALGVVIGASLWIFRDRATSKPATDSASRGVNWRRWSVIAPTMGLVSLGWVNRIPDRLLQVQEQYALDAMSMLDATMLGNFTGWFFLDLAILVLGGLATSWLFYRPNYVLDLWRPVAQSIEPEVDRIEIRRHFERTWMRAAAISICFILLAYVADVFAGGPFDLLGASMVIWLVALGVDLQREIAFRLRHGDVGVADEFHRLYALPVAVDLIESRGIPTLARAQCTRSLLHFFGPHIPIEIMVPADKVEEARGALEV